MADFFLAAFAVVFSLLVGYGNSGEPEWIPVEDCRAAVGEFNAVNAKVGRIDCSFREEKHIAVLEKPAVSEGTYNFAAPDTIRIEYLRPEKYSIHIYGGKLMFTSGGKTKTVDLASNRQFASMAEILTKGGLPSGQGNYGISALETGSLYKFVVTPPKSAKGGEITVIVDRNDMSLVSFTMSQGSSDYSIFTFYDKTIAFK
ncbi:MAG: outer membrane lipoprotein carrier protein LolA [Candidatus Cryptobacteroides sp.]